VLQESEAFAKRAENEAPDAGSRVVRAVQLIWLRSPTPSEQQDFTAFAKDHGFADLCRLLLNSDEFLFVN
jgi:hypothetical protein